MEKRKIKVGDREYELIPVSESVEELEMLLDLRTGKTKLWRKAQKNDAILNKEEGIYIFSHQQEIPIGVRKNHLIIMGWERYQPYWDEEVIVPFFDWDKELLLWLPKWEPALGGLIIDGEEDFVYDVFFSGHDISTKKWLECAYFLRKAE